MDRSPTDPGRDFVRRNYDAKERHQYGTSINMSDAKGVDAYDEVNKSRRSI